INKFDRYQERFAHFQHDPANPNSLSHNRVLALYHDDQDALWIGTDGGGLDRYDRQTGQFTHFQCAPEAPSGLGNNYVSDVVADRRGRLWIATWGGGISVLDPQAGTFVQVRADPLNSDSLSTDTVVSLLIDRQGTLWAATVGAGLDRLAVPDVLDPDRMAFEHFRAARLAPNRLSDSYVFRMIEDLDGTLWLGTRDGGLSHFDPASRRFVTYRADPSTPGALQSNFVPGLLLDRFGTLWIGTAAGLSRYNREDDSFDHFTTEDGLPDDIVVAIQEDDEGYLWLSTQRGLARFDPEREAFKNYGVSDGLQGYEFTTAAARAPDGTLFVGGINGFNRIDPDQVIDNPQVPPVVLTSLEQNGRPLARDASLENLRGITLRWPDNDFQFEFAALNYSQSQRNQYAYMLEGFDDDWNQLGNRRFGRYTNLPGGTYTLRIKGSNNDGLWNEAGTAIAVSVVPPFWQSRWFQLVAVLVLASAAVAGYRLRVRGIRARSLALEEEVKQRTREMERRQQELEALYRADEQLYSHLQLDHVLQSLVDIAVDTLKADKSAVFRWDEAVERYRMRVSRGFSSQALETLAFPRGQGVLDYVT
ncbi:MAG: two-component regulator propeller domain-containing protein, partial [Anaerolineae bacterium]